MNPPSARSLLASYAPIFATMLAIAVFVVAAPSTTGSPIVDAGETGPGAASSTPTDTTTGDAAVDRGDGSTTATTGADVVGSTSTTAGGTSAATTSTGDSTGGGTSTNGGSSATTTSTTGTETPTAATDCGRNEIFRAPTCRPAAFQGDNGGATYPPGVKADEVRVVVYIPKRNEQTTAILAAAGYASTEHRIDLLEAYETSFNQHFETYGRHVKLIFQQGPNDATDPQGQIADAQTAVHKNEAFTIVTSSTSDPFYDELTRLRRPFLQRLDLYDANWFAKRAPYAYTTATDSDVVLGHVAEYYCKRLHGHNAEHAGDATYQASPRKLGIIYMDRFNWGPDLQAKIVACGASVDGPVISYTSDISTANQQATSIASRMKSENVTTVACACDAVAMTFFTQAATNQTWFPEWLITGIGDTDLASNARAFDPVQAQNAFGVSFADYYVPVATRDYYRAYFEGKPDGDPEAARRAGPAYYDQLLYVFSAIEAAGPNLNDQTFAKALASLPPRTSDQNFATMSFGNHGPGPASAVDDLMEIWWDANRTGPDGQRGWYYYVNGGQRYKLGQWPKGAPNVFVNDDSQQPGRDPDA